MNDNNTIFWGVIRNQKDRHTYIELEDLGNGKWGILLDDQEFTIKTDSTNFFDILYEALAKNRSSL
jgi:hypothetical protein